MECVGRRSAARAAAATRATFFPMGRRQPGCAIALTPLLCNSLLQERRYRRKPKEVSSTANHDNGRKTELLLSRFVPRAWCGDLYVLVARCWLGAAKHNA